MGNIFNDDFQEFLQNLNNHEDEYVLVGGYSVILHGYTRTTGDLDVWVNPTLINFNKLHKACFDFGLLLDDLTEDNFLRNDNIDVFTFGRSPISIDLMKKVKGLDFDETYKHSFVTEVQGIQINVIHKNHLIVAKEASNRPKDQDDILHLKAIN